MKSMAIYISSLWFCYSHIIFLDLIFINEKKSIECKGKDYRIQVRRDSFLEHVDFELHKEFQKIYLLGI